MAKLDIIKEIDPAALQSALTPSFHTRQAYADKVKQRETLTIITDDGSCFEKDVIITISWDSILKVIGLIKEQAETVNKQIN